MTPTPPPIACSVCGRTAPISPPTGWMSEVDPDLGTLWVCADCAREHIRSVEARLDQAWW